MRNAIVRNYLKHLLLLLFIRRSSGGIISIIIIVVSLFFFTIRFCGVAVDRVPVMLMCHDFIR